MLDSLLAGMMLFSSFSIRDANVQPNPDDYEVSIGISHSDYVYQKINTYGHDIDIMIEAKHKELAVARYLELHG